MGVSGAGKSRVGRAVAEALGWEFVEGDDHHPAANVDKMSRGVALSDDDRAPWLGALNELLTDRERAGADVVLSCSALKRDYRRRLTDGLDDVQFVHLDVPPEVVAARVADREGHFMPVSLVTSQFEALEAPDESEALILDATRPASELTAEILQRLHATRRN